MSDQFSGLEEQARQARAAQAFIDQASALLASPVDAVRFSCANPPYLGMFSMTLPRSSWAPQLQAQIDAANALLATAVGAVSALKVG